MRQYQYTNLIEASHRSARGRRILNVTGASRAALLLGAIAAAASLYSPRAAAQSAVDGEFSAQRFDPAPGPRNYFGTRGARIDGDMAWSAGLFLNYQHKPFVIRSCEGIENCDDTSSVPTADSPLGRGDDLNVVENFFTADVLGSFTPMDRIQIGLKIPVSFAEGDGIGDGGAAPGLNAFGMGDLKLEVKARAYGEPEDVFVLGAALFGTAPLGSATAEGSYIGDQTFTGGLQGIFDGKQGPFSFGGNLAGVIRGEGRVGSTTLSHEFRYGIGAGFAASPVVRIILDGFGGTKFSSANGTNSLEIDGGIQITPLGAKYAITVGGGAGVLEGVGVPMFRGILGFMWVQEGSDRDQDGLMDESDQCPTDPEDMDGFEDTDGCPEPDNDGDTIVDKSDKCPDKAEDPDGYQDIDGCPEGDNDADGVEDEHDRCPDKKETKNGFKDDDGCPDVPDKDGDGVPDDSDKCVDQPEDTDGFQDTDGCPDPDNDADGITDEEDECVDEPETPNGFKDEDGCPDADAKDKDADGIPIPKDKCPEEKEDKNGIKDDDGCPDALAAVTATSIEIRGVVNFANNDTKIVGKGSFDILDAVAAILVQHPEIEQLEVAGHTDNKGVPAKNQTLSEGRAASCRDYLVKKGVAADRLVPKGYGDTKPEADNRTQIGRDKNRRVEFTILKKK